MQLEYRYLLPCDYAIADSSAKASAIGIFDTIYIPKDKNLVLINIFAVGEFFTSDGSEVPAVDIISIVITDPFGAKLAEASIPTKGIKGSGKSRITFITKLAIQLSMVGKYGATVLMGNSNPIYNNKNFFSVEKKTV